MWKATVFCLYPRIFLITHGLFIPNEETNLIRLLLKISKSFNFNFMDKSHCVKCRNFTYFLVWKFCGKAQSPHSFGRNRAPQNFHTCWKLQHFTQWSAAWLRKSLIRASHEMGSTANAFQKIFKIAFITLSSLSLSLSFSFYLFLFLFFFLSFSLSFSPSRSLFLSCSIFFFVSPLPLFSLSLSFSLPMIASALGQSCWANRGNYCNYNLEFFMRSNT